MKYKFFFGFLFSIALFFVLVPLNTEAQGVATVPQYSAQEVFDILKTIGNWIFVAALLLVPIMLIVGASFVLTGGDNPSRFATGRNVFIGTIDGLLLVLLARAVFAAIPNIFGN